jgi:hypothetical protein
MQNPTDQAGAEASITTETTVTSNDPNWNRTVAVRRKSAKRTHPFNLAAEELNLVSSTPQAEDIPPARKKPRLQEPLTAVTNEAATKTASFDISVPLPPPGADNDNANASADLVTATRVTRHWTSEEDAKLTNSVTNTSKMKWGKEYRTNWAAVAVLVPSRTTIQCRNRWNNALDPSIDRANERKGKWTAGEDSELKDAVQTHGGKNWETIAALVPGRTTIQCRSRWHAILDTNIDPTTARAGKWTADEDKKLKDAVLTHGGENWETIAALVPGRAKRQCSSRWQTILDTNIDPTTARTGKWTTDEDKKLNDAVMTHGGKDWAAIAAWVPGRTKLQCRNRWKEASGRTGKWTADEDKKLKDAVLTHGGESWAAIAALVPGRAKRQCMDRWIINLKPNID